MPTIFAKFGQPILSPTRDEIWAYWAEDMTLTSRNFELVTISDMFHLASNQGKLTKLVQLSYNDVWYASFGCSQSDFAESPHFLKSPYTGPDSVETAVKMISHNSDFTNYLRRSNLQKETDQLLEILQAYQHRYTRYDAVNLQ